MLEQLRLIRTAAGSTPRQLLEEQTAVQGVVAERLQPRIDRAVQKIADRSTPEVGSLLRGLSITAVDIVKQPEDGLDGVVQTRLGQRPSSSYPKPRPDVEPAPLPSIGRIDVDLALDVSTLR